MSNPPRKLPVDPEDDCIFDPYDDGPREECGVVGISGIDLASEQAFLAMYALQHRGQEAAGLVTFDDEGPHVLK
ncbi:MAG: amidophosphoribosyltransferase, partial [Gemmatimonadales bacterium]|nr:amidophosphoribosyltransferase [Gemmatimonadales bacterium]